MQKLKYLLGSGAASVAMTLGVALPAAAATQTAGCEGGRNTHNRCTNVHVNNARHRTRTLGDGSAIIRSHVDQQQTTTATSTQSNDGFAIGVGIGGSADADASSSGREGGDSTAVAVGGEGTGVAVNEQSNTSHTTSTGVQIGGVWFGN